MSIYDEDNINTNVTDDVKYKNALLSEFAIKRLSFHEFSLAFFYLNQAMAILPSELIWQFYLYSE